MYELFGIWKRGVSNAAIREYTKNRIFKMSLLKLNSIFRKCLKQNKKFSVEANARKKIFATQSFDTLPLGVTKNYMFFRNRFANFQSITWLLLLNCSVETIAL